jgi:hypothetical protein
MGVNGDWEIRQEPGGTVSFDLGGSPFVGNEPFSTLTPVATNGKWYHIAAVFSDVDNSYSVYVDGKLQASGISPVDLVPQAAGVLSFGIRAGTSEYWLGALRDVRIYNRRLCPTEIEELYGLVGHWKLNETSGSATVDSSGMGRDGTVIGAATWTAGKINNCIQLDGTNRVEIASLMNAPKNVTLSAWANLTAADTQGAEIVSIGDYIAMRLNDSGTSKVFFYNGTGWVSVSTGQTFAGAGWHHFAAVYNDDQNFCKLYIDGVEVASVAAIVTIPYTGAGTKTVIGSHGNGSTTFDFNGKIDDVRIYNRALCPSEIQELNSGAFSGVRVIKWVEIQ